MFFYGILKLVLIHFPLDSHYVKKKKWVPVKQISALLVRYRPILETVDYLVIFCFYEYILQKIKNRAFQNNIRWEKSKTIFAKNSMAMSVLTLNTTFKVILSSTFFFNETPVTDIDNRKNGIFYIRVCIPAFKKKVLI